MFCSLSENVSEFEFDFHSLIRLHRSRFIELISHLEFFPGQIPILATIDRNDGCTQKDIGKIVMFKPASITDALKRMEKSGLIERKQDKKDLRIVRVFITELGKSQLKEAIKTSNHMEGMCFSSFSDEEKEQFKVLLKKMIKNLENKGEN